MQIQIPRQVYAKVMHWINKSNDEVSGFGKCTYYKETGVLYVHDAYLIKQKNGAAHTDIDGQALAKLLYSTRGTEGELKWWWHSHVNMNVFWSGTDTATIKELAGQGWMAATVFNKREETRSALGYLSSNALTDSEVIIKDELPTYVMDEIDEEMTKLWDKEYDDNVEEKKLYTYPRGTYETTYGNVMTSEGGVRYGSSHGTFIHDDLSTYNRRNAYPNTPIYSPEKAEDFEYYRTQGWTGAGAWEEAKVLGISYQKWMKMLMDNDVKIYDQYDVVLDQALMSGELKPRKEEV